MGAAQVGVRLAATYAAPVIAAVHHEGRGFEQDSAIRLSAEWGRAASTAADTMEILTLVEFKQGVTRAMRRYTTSSSLTVLQRFTHSGIRLLVVAAAFQR
jgi:hypothetical protein